MKAESIVLVGALVLVTQSASAQTAAPEKTAGEAMKNIQVLKDVPISEWTDTMIFMGGALGVGCAHCHVGPFEKDDQKSKQTARLMIKMTREINATNFGGRTEVTCNTCHQGTLHPKAMPSLSTKKPAATAAATPVTSNAQSLPDVDQVMANYRKAAGIDVRSVRMKGAASTGSQGPFPVDIEMSIPDKVAFHASVAGTEILQVLNGERGWFSGRGAITEMTPDNIAAGKLMMDIFRPAKFVSASAPRKVTGIEKIGDRSYAVVESRSAKRLERLYFDTQSGLLYKRAAEIQTALGTAPSEMSFEDYRDVNGVKLPYLVIVHSMSDQAEYKFSEIQINVAIDPKRFEKPIQDEKK